MRVLLWTLALISVAAAQESEATDPQDRDLMVVISGGVSRGAYQAGQMYVFTNWLREIHADEGLRGTPLEDCPSGAQGLACAWAHRNVTVAGSSAGSINALLASLELTSADQEPWGLPEESLSFRTWIPLGFGAHPPGIDHITLSELDHGSWEDHQALINDDLLVERIDAIDAEIRGRRPPIKPVTGTRLVMTAARHQPTSPDQVSQEVTLTFAFELNDPRNPTVLALRCKDRGATDCMLRERWAEPWEAVDPGAPTHTVELPLAARLSVASGTIPGALPLYFLSCQDLARLSPIQEVSCNPSDPEQGLWLMDGGTLENNPVRVGFPFAARQPPDSEAPHPPFLFLDPDLRAQLPMAPTHQKQMWQRYFQIFGFLGSSGNIIDAARNQSLTLYLEDYNVQEALHDAIVSVSMTPYSNFFVGFLGFYDRSIRVWDYYAGMEDAFRWIDAHAGVDLRDRVPSASLFRPLMAYAQDPRDPQLRVPASDACAPHDALVPCPTTLRRVTAMRPIGLDPGQPPEATPALSERELQVWRNLLALSAVHRASEDDWSRGEGWDLNRLGQVLDHCVAVPLAPGVPAEPLTRKDCDQAIGVDKSNAGVRFVPMDLRDGRLDRDTTFSDGLQWYVGWQVRQLAHRDAVSDYLPLDSAAALTRQVLAPTPLTYTLGFAGPQLQHNAVALTLGLRAELRGDDLRVHPMAVGDLRFDWPWTIPAYSVHSDPHWGAIADDGIAIAAQVAPGLNVGLIKRGDGTPPVLGARYRLRLGLAPVGRVVYAHTLDEDRDLVMRYRLIPVGGSEEAVDPAQDSLLGVTWGAAFTIDLGSLLQFQTTYIPNLPYEAGVATRWAERDCLIALRVPLGY